MPSSTDATTKPRVIYMCYDGLLEPLGQSQVVAYLYHLSADFDIHVISFEKPSDLANTDQVARMIASLDRARIQWHRRRYHKRPKIVSTLWDMGGAMLLAAWLAVRYRARLLHARSVLCAAMLYPALLLSRARFIVDIRGFWVDERVDGGLIRAGGPVYRVLKIIEKAMLRRADHIVTLTNASVPVLRSDPRLGRPTAPISVIPTCTDIGLFSAGPPRDATRPLTIGYVGQIGTWYMLDEMLAFFVAIHRHRPDARLLIINKNQQNVIRNAAARVGNDPAAMEIIGTGRDSVPDQIRRMDAGLALIHPFFSKIASAPTKLGEYLGCGVPVVGNVGCGDMARIIEQDAVGVAMADTTPVAIEAAAVALLQRLQDKDLPRRCVASARRHFALDEGVSRYRAIYRELGTPS